MVGEALRTREPRDGGQLTGFDVGPELMQDVSLGNVDDIFAAVGGKTERFERAVAGIVAIGDESGIVQRLFFRCELLVASIAGVGEGSLERGDAGLCEIELCVKLVGVAGVGKLGELLFDMRNLALRRCEPTL